MRRFACALAILAVTLSDAPARAQDQGGSLPCWGFCQLWMGHQDEAASAAPREMRRSAERRHRSRRSPTELALRERREMTEDRDEAWVRQRRHVGTRSRFVQPIVAAPTPVQVRSETPAVAPEPSAQPRIIPVVASPVTASPATRPAAGDIPAAPLE